MLKVSLATGLSTGVVIGLVRGVDRALIPIGEPNLKTGLIGGRTSQA